MNLRNGPGDLPVRVPRRVPVCQAEIHRGFLRVRGAKKRVIFLRLDLPRLDFFQPLRDVFHESDLLRRGVNVNHGRDPAFDLRDGQVDVLVSDHVSDGPKPLL
ncbi:MAG: hypothetical protein BWY42_01809 [Candidatus Omnitrophica bacterium ADurb.Bin277]|nr:MAG: hypothetical protein BWY42_01809 [Candidatus Omnitrophica bacterium ADurb.Bin277]